MPTMSRPEGSLEVFHKWPSLSKKTGMDSLYDRDDCSMVSFATILDRLGRSLVTPHDRYCGLHSIVLQAGTFPRRCR